MTRHISRRRLVLAGASVVVLPAPLVAQQRAVWSAEEARAALSDGQAILLDIRTPEEWRETGVAEGAWPVSMHEAGFPERLFAAKEMAGNNPVALICATGGRTGTLMRALRNAGYSGYVDVSEGMLGSRLGPGWIARGLPVVSAETALDALPADLRN